MKYFFTFIFFCCASWRMYAQETFEYRIPIDNFYATFDEGEDIVNLTQNDNGDYVAVSQYFIDSETQTTSLIKYASNGQIIWRKVLNLDPDVIFTYISPPEICSYDDRYAMIQNQISSLGGLKNFHTLTIFDENGDIIQEHGHLITTQQQFTDITPHNGGFVVASTNVIFPGLTNKLFIYATDIDGFTLWEKQILLSELIPSDRIILHETITDIDDNIYLFCSSEIAHDGIMLIKLNADGEILFINKYEDPTLETWGYDPQCRAAINIQGDLYCYLTWQNNPGVAQYTNLYKFDSEGEVLFTKRIEELVFVTSLSSASDNGFTILFPNLNDQYGVGFEDSKDPALAKFDKNGNFDWGYIYGDEGDNLTDRHIVCDDRGYMIFAHTMEDYYIIKTDIDGYSICETHPMDISTIDFEVEISTPEWSDIDPPGATDVATFFINQDAPELLDKCCLTNLTSAAFEFNFTDTAYEVNFTNNTVNADSYSWDFDDNSNAGYENPVHIFPEAGDYNVCLTAYNECMQNEHCVTITVPEPSIGISEIQNYSSIYPNPAKNIIEIESKKELFKMILRNQQGEIIKETLVNDYHNKLNTAEFPRGLYILELKYSTLGSAYHKIILQ